MKEYKGFRYYESANELSKSPEAVAVPCMIIRGASTSINSGILVEDIASGDIPFSKVDEVCRNLIDNYLKEMSRRNKL